MKFGICSDCLREFTGWPASFPTYVSAVAAGTRGNLPKAGAGVADVPAIPIFRSLTQEDAEFKPSLGYRDPVALYVAQSVFSMHEALGPAPGPEEHLTRIPGWDLLRAAI